MRILQDETARGVRCRDFVLDTDAHPIPGALWTPVEAASPGPASGDTREPGPAPLVLIGHGASGHSHQDYVVALARNLATNFAIASAAIDGPVHGSRREDGGRNGQQSFLDFATMWSSDGEMTDRVIGDWELVLDELSCLEEISGPVGYWGLSMGTILGLPFVAAEPRISAAVLGLMGLTGPTSARIRQDAPKVACPVLFLVQWSDELFPRQTAFELFDALGTGEKSLHANPGTHGEVPNREFAASARFLAATMSARGAV